MTDPFRAKKKPSGQQGHAATSAEPNAGPADEQPTTAPSAAPSAALPSRAELEDMRKADLIELARDRGLDDDGTKADLVDRLSGSR